MKWCRFQSGRTVAYGIIEGTTVTEVTGSPFESYSKTATTSIPEPVKLLVPVIPPTFYAAGVNYREHVTEMAQRRGVKPEFPPNADVGYRANNALIATDEPIVIPKDATDQVQYEGELVAVIGKRCKRVSEAEALDYVFGYTIGNDVSERTWQRGDRTFWRGKNTDTFKPMGPWIVTGLDPDDLRVTIRLNGKEMFTYAVKDAIFGVRQFISRMSQYLTLYPGDVLWMGTDGATENMKDGDVVEVEVPEIGVLRNPVVGERKGGGGAPGPPPPPLPPPAPRARPPGAGERAALRHGAPAPHHRDDYREPWFETFAYGFADTFVGDLYGDLHEHGATVLATPFSRMFVDVNRRRDDFEHHDGEVRSRRGVVRTHTMRDAPIFGSPSGSPTSKRGCRRSTTRTIRPWTACSPSSPRTTAERSCSTATPAARAG